MLVRRTGQLMESRIDDDLVALNVDQGVCYGFNATAARIWDLTETPIRLSELHLRLLAEFDVDPGTCAAEVQRLLGQLQDDGLIAIERPEA
jgi:hypothetical protein